MQFWIALNITFPVSLGFKQVVAYIYKQQFLRTQHNIKTILQSHRQQSIAVFRSLKERLGKNYCSIFFRVGSLLQIL